jgi:hypothetical protein
MYRSLLLLLVLLITATRPALAQSAPARDKNWKVVSHVGLIGAASTQLLMPRIFYSDPEATVGWKARWHVSVLAPVMTLAGLAVLNEYGLKESFEGYRPSCDKDNQGTKNCETYGMMSTHSLGAFSALGHGGAVFLFDTINNSGGRFNAGSFVGNIGLPAVFATFTAIGRGVGDYETAGQVFTGGGVGLASGFLMGMTYALMQRPACGYSGSLVCW